MLKASSGTSLASLGDSRLLLVSNRLPVTIKQTDSSTFTFTPGSGGLISGLSGLSKSTDFVWYGWPAIDLESCEEEDALRIQLKKEHNAVPVFLDAEIGEKYYNGFANSILWPLIHYHPGEIVFAEEAWVAYQAANREFARVVAQDVKEGDLVWVHDFHLMLLPAMLREELGPDFNIKIGFFLHTPFPSSEIYRILPVREEILKGVLESDLIGFHTNDYARHFLSSCSRVLELSTTMRNVTFNNRTINVGSFPIGIQPERFTETLSSEAVTKRISELEKTFKRRKVMVGVDRLDYVKGVPLKLKAFEQFLRDNPQYVGKAVLVQVAIPTRGEVEEYQNLRSLVNELVGRINGKFGSIEYTPIHFIHKSVDFEELLALYTVSDVCIVASTRDGMNLVSFEYIACQEGRHGAMILSEFAGSAESLAGSIIVNPWDTSAMARAMASAIMMGVEERKERFEAMNAYVQNNTSAFWGRSFVKELQRIRLEPEASPWWLKLGAEPRPVRIDWKSYDGSA